MLKAFVFLKPTNIILIMYINSLKSNLVTARVAGNISYHPMYTQGQVQFFEHP